MAAVRSEPTRSFGLASQAVRDRKQAGQRVDETEPESDAEEFAEAAPRGDQGWDAGNARRAAEGTRGRFVSMAQMISGLS